MEKKCVQGLCSDATSFGSLPELALLAQSVGGHEPLEVSVGRVWGYSHRWSWAMFRCHSWSVWERALHDRDPVVQSLLLKLGHACSVINSCFHHGDGSSICIDAALYRRCQQQVAGHGPATSGEIAILARSREALQEDGVSETGSYIVRPLPFELAFSPLQVRHR